MISKKKLLSDDKFKIGFEFEFVAYDFTQSLGPKHLRKLRVPELLLTELELAFVVSKQNQKRIRDILSLAVRKSNQYMYTSVEDIIQYGTERIVAVLGLIPRGTVYRRRGKKYYNVTDEICAKIKSVDRSDVDSINSLVRTLSRCYVDSPVAGKYVTVAKPTEEALYALLASELKTRYGYDPKRIDSYETGTKKNPGWYLTEEYVDEIVEDKLEYGFELITPPLPPKEALEALANVFEFMRTVECFKVRTGPTCGVHINISHEDILQSHINETFYAFSFDEAYWVSKFGRSTQNMCSAIRPEIIKEIKRMTRSGSITLDGLDNMATRGRVLEIIESYSEWGSLNSVRFSNMKDYGYSEYRVAGGKKYEERYDDIEELFFELLRLTLEYDRNYLKDKKFINTIRKIMVDVGGKTGTGPSIVELLPESMLVMRKRARNDRKDSDKLMRIRDK